MKAPRDILKHVIVEIAKRQRKCYRDKSHQVLAGQRCLVIKEASFGGSKNYCRSCASEILSAAGAKRAVLEQELEASR